MKVLAKDLKHGQRFRIEGNEYMASGSIDQNGACVCLDRLNRLAWIDGDNEVELIDPPAEPTYRPYTDAELLEQLLERLGEKVRLKVRLKESQNVYILISVQGGFVETSDQVFAADLLLAEYEHLDGTPCVVEEQP